MGFSAPPFFPLPTANSNKYITGVGTEGQIDAIDEECEDGWGGVCINKRHLFPALKGHPALWVSSSFQVESRDSRDYLRSPS